MVRRPSGPTNQPRQAPPRALLPCAARGAQVVGKHLKAARAQPPYGLVVRGMPRWQVIGHRPPGRAVGNRLAQPMEHFAQLMRLLLPADSGSRARLSATTAPSSSATSDGQDLWQGVIPKAAQASILSP
jgi:hypothetical protein